MSDQLDQQNDPVFKEEQAHLSSLYQKLLQMRDAISQTWRAAMRARPRTSSP